LFDRETPAGIIAHRAGGTLASENSLEGLQAAIDHGCHGSEIDVPLTYADYYFLEALIRYKNL
jgi:glycerophosphoryl diester phosphodiesterase